jgi:hypothetical protein
MTVDDINLLQRHEILAQLESLVTNGVDADFKATLRRVKKDCGWNESQKLSAALGSAILRFLYKCPKASAFEDAHFYALQKTGIRFTNREDAREFFYIISEAKFKATKQDEMASKALFVQGHPDSERIPPSCVAPQRTNDDTTRKSTRDSSKKPAGKGKETSNNSQKRKSSTDSEDVVPRRGTSMKNPSSKKTKCEHKSASKTPAPGSRTTRNSSGDVLRLAVKVVGQAVKNRHVLRLAVKRLDQAVKDHKPAPGDVLRTVDRIMVMANRIMVRRTVLSLKKRKTTL